MARPKKLFLCMNCQGSFGQWSGKCPNCGEWNTLVEQSAEEKELDRRSATPAVLTVVGDIKTPHLPRLRSKSQEFDRVLGANDPGIVPGAVILMAGAPGVGKSTLLLQIAASVAGALYFSAEESLEQIRLRTNRLKLQASQLTISAERDLDRILAAIQERRPSFVVVDSIQTIYDTALPSTPGSLVQVRENCWRIQQFAKNHGIAFLVVSHVTKEGVVAGPKVLEHLVDVVLYLEGEKRTGLRLLRVDKNRFGPTDEVGIWQLEERGFVAVADPGRLFADLLTEPTPGRALTITLEGTQAFIIEVQALVTKTSFGYPKRTAQGMDLNRLNLILAVLENRLQVPLNSYDVFVNIVGGFSVKDPGTDVAVAAAILSSIRQAALPDKSVFVGEIGLLGEIRPAFNQARRAKEAKRLDYQLVADLRSVNKLNTFMPDPPAAKRAA